MKNLLIILFSFFFLQKGFAQEKTDTIDKINNKWSIGFTVEPTYSFRKITGEFVAYTEMKPRKRYTDVYLLYKSNNEKPKIGFSTSVLLSFKCKNWLNVKTEISYMNLGYKTNLIDTLQIAWVGDPGGTGNLNLYTNSFSSRTNFNFISLIPKLEFGVLNRSHGSLYFDTGIGISYLLFATEKRFDYQYDNIDFGGKYSLIEKNKVFLVGEIGLGFNSKISERINFCLHPKLMYSITKLNNYNILFTPGYKNLYSFGSDFELSISL